MSHYLPGTEIRSTFYDGTAGLTDSDFTKRLYRNGEESALTTSVSEIGNGYYYAAFIPPVAETSAIYEMAIERAGAVWLGTFPVKQAATANVVQEHGKPTSIGIQLSYLKSMIDSIYQMVWRGFR